MFNSKNTFLRHTLSPLEKGFNIRRQINFDNICQQHLIYQKPERYCKAYIIMEAIISTYFDHFNLQSVTCISYTIVH